MMSEHLDLLGYRRLVFESYARARAGGIGEEVWRAWVADRNALFATHPQSPVEDRSAFTGIPYFDYDPEWRVVAELVPIDRRSRPVANSDTGETRFMEIGKVDFEFRGQAGKLTALWLDSYGGGLFIPFRDATNGHATYGGGRYLLDTVKGADLGHQGDELILDFNYAYHPSCVHSPRWSCPLAPPENRLDFAIAAGERLEAPPPDNLELADA